MIERITFFTCLFLVGLGILFYSGLITLENHVLLRQADVGFKSKVVNELEHTTKLLEMERIANIEKNAFVARIVEKDAQLEKEIDSVKKKLDQCEQMNLEERQKVWEISKRLIRDSCYDDAPLKHNLMYDAYPNWVEGGYANKRTVLQGDVITFFIATELESFKAVVIFMDGVEPKKMSEYSGLKGNDPRFGDCRPDEGCHWKPTVSVLIEKEWPSGWYQLHFPILRNQAWREVSFFVAERIPRAALLYVVDVTTALTINAYGGGNSYLKFNQTGRWTHVDDDPKSYFAEMSFMRPLTVSKTFSRDNRNRLIEPDWFQPIWAEETFRKWIIKEFNSMEDEVAFITNDAINVLGYDFIRMYPCIIIAGYNSYLPSDVIISLERYVTAGGNLFLSSREFGYANVRFASEKMIFYRSPHEDKWLRGEKETAYGAFERWRSPMVSENNLDDLFGISIRHETWLNPNGGAIPMNVVNESHWMFEETDYKNGDPIATVEGLGVGGKVVQVDSKYCISTSNISCDKIEITAYVDYPASDEMETSAFVGLIKKGAGTIFVGPGEQWNSPSHQTRARVNKNILCKLSNLMCASERDPP